MSAVIAICTGACFGALARWQLGVWLTPLSTHLGQVSLGTLAANWIGGYLVGVCVAIFQTIPDLEPTWRLFWVTGLLGALTTFSSFSAEVVSMLTQQRYTLALSTTALHLFGSLLLTALGIESTLFVIARSRIG